MKEEEPTAAQTLVPGDLTPRAVDEQAGDSRQIGLGRAGASFQVGTDLPRL